MGKVENQWPSVPHTNDLCCAEHHVSVHGSADDWIIFTCKRSVKHLGLHEDRWQYVIRPEEQPEDAPLMKHEAVLQWTGDCRVSAATESHEQSRQPEKGREEAD